MNNLNANKDIFLAKWLEGELTDKELKNLVSPEDYSAFLKLKKGIEISEALERPMSTSFDSIKNKVSNSNKKTIPLYAKWFTGVAAAVIVLFGMFNLLNNPHISVNSGYGELKTVQLLDGSEVILNANSSISYDEKSWEDERVVELMGEAYFKVAKGKTFTVQTSNGNVQVLGTQFNVNSTQDYFDVTCYEGKVKVSIKDQQSHILTPSQNIRKNNGFEVESYKDESIKPSWLKGESTFKSVPLHIVILAIENQYQVSFDTSDLSTDLNYSGAFPHDNLDITLKTVFETLHINYTFINESNIKLSHN